MTQIADELKSNDFDGGPLTGMLTGIGQNSKCYNTYIYSTCMSRVLISGLTDSVLWLTFRVVLSSMSTFYFIISRMQIFIRYTHQTVKHTLFLVVEICKS